MEATILMIEDLGFAAVPAIMVICYLIGRGLKAAPWDVNDYIPVIVGACGGLLGMVGMVSMAEFPAHDYMTAVAVGIVSGLSATGIHEIIRKD